MNTSKTTIRTLAAAAILGTSLAAAPAFADNADARPAETLVQQQSGKMRGQAAGESREAKRAVSDESANLNRSQRIWHEMAIKQSLSN